MKTKEITNCEAGLENVVLIIITFGELLPWFSPRIISKDDCMVQWEAISNTQNSV